MHEYDEANDRIDASVGEPFIIVLEERGTSGYAWTCEVDEGQLRVDRRSSEPDSNSIGAAAQVGFEVTPLRAGTVAISFRYGRPWESEPERVHRVTVSVR